MNENIRTEALLYQFLQGIYWDLSTVTRVEVDVEELNGGALGTPRRETLQVRVYANDEQVFPDIQTVPYWKGILKKFPDLFTGCRSLQERVETMMRFLKDERIYLEYGLDWSASAEKGGSPLCFSMEELCRITDKETEVALDEDEEEWEGENELSEAESSFVEAALETLSEEWVQNVFGDQVTDVLFDVLTKFLKRSAFVPRRTPLSQRQMRTIDLRGDLISGVVPVDLGDIMEYGHEWLLDEVSRLLTSTELLADIEVHVVGHEGDTLWLKVEGDAKHIVDHNIYYYYLEELSVFTQEETDTICAASGRNPWIDQGESEAVGRGNVLPVKYLDSLGEGVVIPEGIIGTRHLGLFIDGNLPDVLHHFHELGELCDWRVWPDSNFAVVVPDTHYANPMNDPLMAQLIQCVPLEEAFPNLEDLKLTFLALYEGYLLVKNKHGQIESWPMLLDGQGSDENRTEFFPVVEHEGDLYHYGNTCSTREEAYAFIRHEIEK